MENVTRTIRLFVLVAASVALPARAGAEEASAPTKNSVPSSETRTASCLLQIITEPSILSLNRESIIYLFQSSGVFDRAAAEVLGLPGELVSGCVDLRVQVLQQVDVAEPVHENRILLKLDVHLSSQDAKPAAREFLGALIANFQENLNKAYQDEGGRWNTQINLAKAEVQRAEAELTATQKNLREISERDLSSQAVRSSITALTSQLQNLRLEKATREAYRQALLERIRDIREETEKSLKQDTISIELQQIVQRRLTALKNLKSMAESGRTPVGLDAEEDKLSTAMIDLARRREELSKAGSAGGLSQLTNELTTLTLEAAQAEAKEKQLQEQLQEVRESLARAAEYERVTLKLEVAKQNLQEAMIQHNKARQRACMLRPPAVSVIGG
jgi:hypothetical protein